MKKKNKKLFQNLLKATYEYIKGKHYTPLSKQALLEKLQIFPLHNQIFEAVLSELRKEGLIEYKEKRYHPTLHLEPSEVLCRGSISVHPKGYGFVTPMSEAKEDIFIPKPFMDDAIDGDVVDVLVDTQNISPKGPEGKVVSVIERTRKHVIATLTEGKKAFSPLFGPTQLIEITKSKKGVKKGSRVRIEISDWGTKRTPPQGKVIDLIGDVNDPSSDIPFVLEEYAIKKEFPEKVLEACEPLHGKITKKEKEKRKDFRALETFTIDPDTAKDFDDALSIEKEKDKYILHVHIADVSHFVKPGSELDEEAAQRSNSTYLPRLCIPMLPPKLSENLCSLKENVDRFAVTASIHIDFQGNFCGYTVDKSIIRSKKRFTYKEAKAVLDGKAKSPHKKALQELQKLCGLLKKKRKERGSVELNISELIVLVDEKGAPTCSETVLYDITHQMVEECMLAANEVVASHVALQKGKHLTFRIHEEPSKENLKDFSALCSVFGFKLSEEPTPHEIQKLFLELEESPFYQFLSRAYIKTMRLAIYSPDNIGHYGLSLEHYCHFTSPIRRYVDLIAHRVLFDEIEYDKDAITAISERASSNERQSSKAEMRIRIIKKLRYFEKLIQDDKYRSFEAVVTRIKPFGIYFDIGELMFEGFLHISELDNDYFFFDEKSMSLKGSHRNSSYKAGDTIWVMVKKLCLLTEKVSFELMGHEHHS